MDATLYALLTDGATVLTASRHLAHRLRQDYAAAAQTRKLIVWPTPRILPWTTYLRAATQQQRDQPPPDKKIPGLRLLTDQQALALWEKIVAESDSGQALLNPAQAARNAQRSWQLLNQYQIPLRKVAAYPGEETQAFAAWCEQFIALTDTQHWLDGARFAQYLLDGSFKPDDALVMYGVDRETPDMHSLLQAWLARGVTVHRINTVARAARVQVVAAADSDSEVRLAAQWARQQVQAGKTRVAVIAPRLPIRAAQLQRQFADVFAPEQRRIDRATTASAFRVVATPRLSGYPLVHHALLLLQLLQGRADILLAGQLLRSPFLAGHEVEAAARALADIKARDQRRERWDCHELERLAAVCECPQLAANLQLTANYLREHRSAALPSEWTERFTQLLKLSGWSRGRPLDSTEQQTLNKFQQVLAQLSALDELIGKLTLEHAVAQLRDACHALSFAPESLDQTVTIIDADNFAGMTADALWVMGLHAGDWPPAPDPDPFIPVELQRQHGLPYASAESCLQLAQRQLQRMVQAADEVILSWPQQDEDAQLRPSPLLAAWPTVNVAALLQAGTSAPRQHLFAARPEMETLVDDHAPALAPGQVHGGAQIVELQSRCPFRAQAQLRLHAEPVPNVSPAVEATERGKLVHRVLTELWQQLRDSDGLKAALNLASVDRASARHAEDVGLKPDLQIDLTSELQQTVRHIAERVAPQIIPARTAHRQRLAALEVELCVQWIMALLRVEAQRLPFRVRHTEQREAFEFAGLQMNIQLDRLDELSDGGTLLIDYKTGDSNQASDWLDHTPNRPRSPQLPLYALAHRQQLAGIAFAVLAPGKAGFRGLADTDSIAPGITDYAQHKPYRKLPGVESWDDLLQHWQAVLTALAQQYLSGAAYVDPLKNECTYCHLSSLCRIHELLEADADAGQDKDG